MNSIIEDIQVFSEAKRVKQLNVFVKGHSESLQILKHQLLLKS